MRSALFRQLIVSARFASSAPPHDLIERFEVCPRPPVHEELRRLKRRDLFRHRRRHKLIDARAILPAQPLNSLLERSWQPQRIGSSLFHLLIPPVAQTRAYRTFVGIVATTHSITSVHQRKVRCSAPKSAKTNP